MKNVLVNRDLYDSSKIKIHGRHTRVEDCIVLFWTGSGIELNVTGSELWIEFETDYDELEQWISIEINNSFTSRMMLPKGKSNICIFRLMDKDKVKNVRIYKDVQPMGRDKKSIFKIISVQSDGEFLKVDDRKLKIEFIGDSISSGEGTCGATENEEWTTMFFTCRNAYPCIVSKLLNCDFRIISQSGWGVYSAYDNNIENVLPRIYDKVCGAVSGTCNDEYGASEANDFSLWVPDIIVVNLGTNDGGAFSSPEWIDENTGIRYKQRKTENEMFNMEDLKKFENAAISFLKKLRMYNKSSEIIWCYGCLDNSMMGSIYRAIDTYRYETEDNHVYVLPLSNMEQNDVGSRYHPGAKYHEKAARQIEEFINQTILKK